MGDTDYLKATGRLPVTALYDPVLALTMRERAFRRAVVAAALLRRPTNILDVGSGTGTLTISLAQAAPEAVVTGVDGDPEILERARRKAAAAGADVDYVEGRAEQLPFPGEAFDSVASTLVLHHLAPAPKREAISEAARVLRPGGRLVIADWGRPLDPLSAVAFVAVRLLDGFAPTRDHAAGNLPRLLSAAGLRDVRTEQRWRTVWGTLDLITAEKRHDREDRA